MGRFLLKHKKLLLVALVLILCLFMLLIIIITSVFTAVASVFQAEKKAKALDHDNVFPIEVFYLYREIDEEFGVPWSLAAGIHFVQTDFTVSVGFLSRYKDILNLPDEVWDTYKLSREYHYIKKEWLLQIQELYDQMANEEDEEARESLRKQIEDMENHPPPIIEPNRKLPEDVLFTLGSFFEGIPEDDLQDRIYQITKDRRKADQALFYFWLFHNSFGNAGWPVSERYGREYITSYFGERVHPITGEVKMHNGIDIAPPQGEDIYAFADGIVFYSGPATGYGTLIIIEHTGYVQDDGTEIDIRTYYGHSQNLQVENGQVVIGGQKIAEIGNEGDSTGPHLHFEVHERTGFSWNPVDPMDYVRIPDELQD